MFYVMTITTMSRPKRMASDPDASREVGIDLGGSRPVVVRGYSWCSNAQYVVLSGDCCQTKPTPTSRRKSRDREVRVYTVRLLAYRSHSLKSLLLTEDVKSQRSNSTAQIPPNAIRVWTSTRTRLPASPFLPFHCSANKNSPLPRRSAVAEATKAAREYHARRDAV